MTPIDEAERSTPWTWRRACRTCGHAQSIHATDPQADPRSTVGMPCRNSRCDGCDGYQ